MSAIRSINASFGEGGPSAARLLRKPPDPMAAAGSASDVATPAASTASAGQKTGVMAASAQTRFPAKATHHQKSASGSLGVSTLFTAAFTEPAHSPMKKSLLS